MRHGTEQKSDGGPIAFLIVASIKNYLSGTVLCKYLLAQLFLYSKKYWGSLSDTL